MFDGWNLWIPLLVLCFRGRGGDGSESSRFGFGLVTFNRELLFHLVALLVFFHFFSFHSFLVDIAAAGREKVVSYIIQVLCLFWVEWLGHFGGVFPSLRGNSRD